VLGTLKLAAAADTVACVGTASAEVVDTLPPDAFDNSTVSVVADPVYWIAPEVSKLSNVPALPDKVSVRTPFKTVELTLFWESTSAVAAVLGTLSLSVSVSSAPAFPSSRSAFVNTNHDGVFAVIDSVLGRLVIAGTIAAPEPPIP
jgi:hypothetical protein